MATVNIYNGYSVDMLNWNFSKAAQYGIASWIHSNINIYGTNYASAYEVEMNINGAFFDDIFAGNFTTNASGAVTGGTISAIYEQAWNGYAWVLAESFTGFSYSAVAIYNAAISGGGQSATTQIEVSVLSGNDTITGSTGNDRLFGGGGNDVINGGGGIDTVVYLGNRSDYTISRHADGSTSVVDNINNIYDGNDGADTLYNISYLEFADQTIAAPTAWVPTISGAIGGQTTFLRTPVKPFAYVTIGDANVGATDTLTITMGGAGGTLTDGSGFSGLTSVGSGVYRLSGTASAITNELDALVFKPSNAGTTTFTLSDWGSEGSASAVDSTTSVINYDGVTVTAYNGLSVSMFNLNLPNYALDGYQHWIYSNLNINGTIYPSAYVFGMNINGTLIADTLAGNLSTNASGVVTGGVVTGYYEQVWNGSAWEEVSSTTGFSYSAVNMYNAAISGSQSAAAQIELYILSGNDTITGSTGNDTLFGGAGNDVINGGGGIDTVVYFGNRSDYTISRHADGSTSVVDYNSNTVDGNDGADTLYNISYLEFADQTIAAPTAWVPTILGAIGGQTTISETPVKPFAYVTIGDANVGATDTLTITMGGAGGTLTDGSGFSGLTSVGSGVYRLSGTASAITNELDALVFKPSNAGTTTFTLSDWGSEGSASAVDSTTSVIDYFNLIDAIYEPVLQRAPTSAEVVAGLSMSASAGISAAIASVVDSPEAQLNVYPIVQIVELATGNMPTAHQLSSWVPFVESNGLLQGNLQSNPLLDQMAEAFVASTQFGNTYNSGTAVDPNAIITGPIVSAIIKAATGLAATQTQINNWLATHQTIDQVFVDFALGDQYSAHLQSTVQQSLTGLAETAAGVTGWTYSGTNDWLTSTQVQQAYQSVLQRAPSTAEANAALSIDATIGNVGSLVSIVDSPEAQNNVYPIVQVIELATGNMPIARQLASWVPFVESHGLLQGNLQSNPLLDQMAEAFVASTQFGNTYNSGTAVDPNAIITGPIVSAIIKAATGVAATQTQINNWVGTGLTIDQVFVEFALGDQYSAHSQSTVQAFLTATAINGAGLSTVDAINATGTLVLGVAGTPLTGNNLNILGGSGALSVNASGTGDTITELSTSTAGATITATGSNTTVNLSAGGASTIIATGDLTGATTQNGTSTAGIAMTTLANVMHGVGDQIVFHNAATEVLAGSSAVNVSSAASLAGALDMGAAAAAASQGGQIGANTGVIAWLQYGGNTYVVEAINTGSVAAAHPALVATDEVVTIVGSVDLSGASLSGHTVTL